MQPKVSPYVFPLMKREPPKAQDIMQIVSKITKVKLKEIVSHGRAGDRPTARHLLFYLIRKHTGMSLVKIGKLVGGRDHTTVLNSINTAMQLMESDDRFKKWLKLSEIEIQNNFITIDHVVNKARMTHNAYILSKKVKDEEEPEIKSTYVRHKGTYSNPQYIY